MGMQLHLVFHETWVSTSLFNPRSIKQPQMSNFSSGGHIVNEGRKCNWASLTASNNQMHEPDLLANKSIIH